MKGPKGERVSATNCLTSPTLSQLRDGQLGRLDQLLGVDMWNGDGHEDEGEGRAGVPRGHLRERRPL